MKERLQNIRGKITVQNMRKQIRSYNTEAGKRYAIVVFVIGSLFLGGATIPSSWVEQFVFFTVIMVNGLAVGLLADAFYRGRKKDALEREQLKQDFDKLLVQQEESAARSLEEHNVLSGTVDMLQNYRETGIMKVSLNTNEVLYINPIWEEIFQWPFAEFRSLMSGYDSENFVTQILDLLTANNKTRIRLERRFRSRFTGLDDTARYKKLQLKRKDDSQFYADAQVSVVRSNGSRVLIIVVRDMTEEEHKEATMQSLLEFGELLDGYFKDLADRDKYREISVEGLELLKVDKQ